MEDPRHLIRRIKWKSVFTVLVLLLIVFFVILGFNPFGLDYKGEGDIKIKSWLEPQKIDLKGTSTVWVEVKNDGKYSKDVEIFLETYDPDIKFLGEVQEKNASVTLGPGESRKLDFKVKAQATYGGSYGISIEAKYDYEEVEDEIYLTLFSS